jgi:hypothetical protein
MTFKKRILVMFPVLFLGILSIVFLPEPYNRYTTIFLVLSYWIIIMFLEWRMKKIEKHRK